MDFQFRVNYKTEKLNKEHPLVKIILDSWSDSKKHLDLLKSFHLKNVNPDSSLSNRL